VLLRKILRFTGVFRSAPRMQNPCAGMRPIPSESDAVDAAAVRNHNRQERVVVYRSPFLLTITD
jgi:hypothetical protein